MCFSSLGVKGLTMSMISKSHVCRSFRQIKQTNDKKRFGRSWIGNCRIRRCSSAETSFLGEILALRFCFLRPCLYGKVVPGTRVTLGSPTIHTFLYKSKRARFTWQITTCFGEEGDPGGRVTWLTRWGNPGCRANFSPRKHIDSGSRAKSEYTEHRLCFTR